MNYISAAINGKTTGPYVDLKTFIEVNEGSLPEDFIDKLLDEGNVVGQSFTLDNLTITLVDPPRPLTDQAAHIKSLGEAYDGCGIVSLDTIDWENTDRCYDWRNHIPQSLKQMWSTLADETKAAVYYMAVIEADKEEWD